MQYTRDVDVRYGPEIALACTTIERILLSMTHRTV